MLYTKRALIYKSVLRARRNSPCKSDCCRPPAWIRAGTSHTPKAASRASFGIVTKQFALRDRQVRPAVTQYRPAGCHFVTFPTSLAR